MKKTIILLIFAFLAVIIIHAQTGNVGIGTSAPGSKLTVNGSFATAYRSVTGNYTMTAADFYVVSNSTSNSTITLPIALALGSGNYRGRLYEIKNTHTTSTLTVAAASGERIDDIGTAGVASITVTPGDGVLLVSNGNTSGTTWEVVSFHSAVPTKDYDWMKTGNQLPTSPADSMQNIYHIGGNVGIGTNTPLARLHIAPSPQGGRFPRLLVESHNCGSPCAQRPGLTLGLYNENVTSGDNGASLGFMDSRTSDTASAAIFLVNRNVSQKFGGLGFRTRSLATEQDPTEKMRITAAGNVGIGTSAPAEKLHVAGTVRIADGTQGAGKLFVSDANGTGSWQAPAQTKEILALGNTTAQNVLNAVAAGGWTTLTNFDVLVNTIPGASFNTGNEMVTLPEGTYEISVSYEFSFAPGACPAEGFLINSYFVDFPNNSGFMRVHANSPSICSAIFSTHSALWNTVVTIPAGGQTWELHVGRGQGGNYLGEANMATTSRILIKRIL